MENRIINGVDIDDQFYFRHLLNAYYYNYDSALYKFKELLLSGNYNFNTKVEDIEEYLKNKE